MKAVALLSVLLIAGACAPDDEPSGPVSDPPASTEADTPSATPSEVATDTPSPEKPLSVAVIGDFGSGLPEQTEVAQRMCSWRERHGFDHVFTTGDNIYPEGDPAVFDERFFQPYDCLLSNGVKWHAALGNHDVIIENGAGELSEPAFGIESRNYVVRLDDVKFVIADSNRLNLDFLRRRTRSGDWVSAVVVAFHHPVFSGGDSHGPTPGLASKVLRLFARRDVDLVLHGHDHVYSKSKPVGGVRYVVTGGGGAKLNGCRPSTAIVKCEARHHFLYLTFGDEAIRVRAVPTSGRPFDTFDIPL